MTNREKAERFSNRFKKEQKTILELLKPHFGDSLHWGESKLKLGQHIVVYLTSYGNYINDYEDVYVRTKINRNDIFNKFEKLSFEELCDAIVKPWDVNRELKRVADKYDWIDVEMYPHGGVKLKFVQGTKYTIKNKNLVTAAGGFHFDGWGGKPIENDLIFNENNLCKLTEENFPEFERVIAEMDKQINQTWSLEWAHKDLVETFDWLVESGSYILFGKCKNLILDPKGDVNYYWSKDVLIDHPTFKFNAEEKVLLTEENYEEFKSVLKWYEDNVMTLKKPWEDE